MNKKTKQLNDLISLHDDEYKTLSMKLNDIRIEYQNSIDLIYGIKSSISKYNDDMASAMVKDAESYIRNYKNIKDYIIYLDDEVSNEIEKRDSILHSLNILEDDCISLKVKIRGYELLIEQNESDIHANSLKAQNIEIDDMWLLNKEYS